MISISNFYTLFWTIYFPTCIAFNDIPGFSNVDEIMTVVLIGFTIMNYSNKKTNMEPWKEYMAFLGVLVFYVVYSLILAVNVSGAVWLDLVQQIRPYSILYCTWILAPRFVQWQKKTVLIVMILTLFAWILYHPETVADENAEFPVLGQLAICTGMAYYLFTKDTLQNRCVALVLVCTGLFAPKMKFVGEVVCFVALLFFIRKKFNMRSPSTVVSLVFIITLCVIITWERFDAYYVRGWENEALARPMTYKTSWNILCDYIPFGSGMGTFACNAAWRFYSPLYPQYGLDKVWGLDAGGGFICDAFYPVIIAQFGIAGVILFLWFWKRRLNNFSQINDIKYYRVAMMAFFCLAIESVADTSYLSGKGMGYFMLIGLCLNANRGLIKFKRPRITQISTDD